MSSSDFNRQHAVVEETKVVDYLLNINHPAGAGKARFFLEAGYSRAKWTQLRDDLLLVAHTGTISQCSSTVHGRKAVVDGSVDAPNGTTIHLRTVWINTHLDEVERLVTAYPGKN